MTNAGDNMMRPPRGTLLPDNRRDPTIANPRMTPNPRRYDGPWPKTFMAIIDPAKDSETDTTAILSLSIDSGAHVPDDQIDDLWQRIIAAQRAYHEAHATYADRGFGI
jgi:hypothetical protein